MVINTDVVPRKSIKGQFFECSMASLPFPNNSFDSVYCLHVLAHFKEGEKGINEAFRVLKKGGKLMVLTPNKWYVYYVWFVNFLQRRPSLYDVTARWLYSKRSLLSLFGFGRFSNVRFHYFRPPPRLLPFRFFWTKTCCSSN